MTEELIREGQEIRNRNRHRMIGAAILMLVLVVVVPQFLEHAVFPKSVKSSVGLVVEKGASKPEVAVPAPPPAVVPEEVPMPVAPVTVTEIPANSPIAKGGVSLPSNSEPETKAAPQAKTVSPKVAASKVAEAPPAAEKPAPAAAHGVLLQAGVFHNAGKAQTLSARLNDQGFHSRVEKQDDAGTPVYRVLLGPMKTRAEAAEVKARLEKIQISVLVKPQK
jgi:DedD protein